MKWIAVQAEMSPEWNSVREKLLWFEVQGPLSCCTLGFQKCTFGKIMSVTEQKIDISIFFSFFPKMALVCIQKTNCNISAKRHMVLLQYPIYSISSGTVLKLCLCLWTPCLISISECPSRVGVGWQLLFVFHLQYVCLILPLIVCGILFNGPKGTTSVRIAHFIQHETMTKSDLRLVPAQKHTNAHYPNQSVWHPLLGIIGEKGKKSEEKINRRVATLKELLLHRHMPFPHVRHSS